MELFIRWPESPRHMFIAALAMLFIAATATSSLAHGPCGDHCLSALSGAPGETVDILQPEAVLVIWNPPHNIMALGIPGQDKKCDNRCASQKPIYHLDQQTIIMHRSETPSLVKFDVPDAEPGRYVIAIYDGSESGLHYTWTIFEVLPGGEAAHDQQTSHARTSAGESPPSILIASGMALLTLGAILGWLVKRPR